MATTITSKGQVTIPKHIRDALHSSRATPSISRSTAKGKLSCSAPNEGRRAKVQATALPRYAVAPK